MDNGYADANQLHITLMGPGECLIDNVEVFAAGSTNLIGNSTFENGTTGWVFQGNHNASGLETSEGYASTRSPPSSLDRPWGYRRKSCPRATPCALRERNNDDPARQGPLAQRQSQPFAPASGQLARSAGEHSHGKESRHSWPAEQQSESQRRTSHYRGAS